MDGMFVSTKILWDGFRRVSSSVYSGVLGSFGSYSELLTIQCPLSYTASMSVKLRILPDIVILSVRMSSASLMGRK